MAAYADSKAIEYARKYYSLRNYSYNHYDADCTNFVSQCVKAGGKSMTKPADIGQRITKTTKYWYVARTPNGKASYRYDESSSFINVSDFYTYWINHEITAVSYSTKVKLQGGAIPGDVVQLKNGDGKWFHSIIITGGSKGARTYCVHSNNIKDAKVANISGAVSYRT